ncbi:MAG: hypothetical protein JO115_12540 [Pseudonocardiales bacterium]|nr:hypothetical protein [Pseudonocardiales bacterium]
MAAAGISEGGRFVSSQKSTTEVDALPPATFGGEVEALVIDADGHLGPMTPELRNKAVSAIAEETHLRGELDLYACTPQVSWDVPRSTPELNLGVYDTLPAVVHSARLAISTLNHVLSRHGLSLLATAYHPSDTEEYAYRYVVNKPIYRLFRGTRQGPTNDLTTGERAMLAAAWPDQPERGRGFDHRVHSLSAGIHVWTRTDPESAGSHLAVIHALGWMFNLLTANGPFRHGLALARDVRLTTWDRFLAPSRCPRDLLVGRPLPEQPKGLADYFSWVMSFCPLAVPDVEAGGGAWDHPLAVIPPDDLPDWSILDFLECDQCRVVGLDGRVRWIEPQFAHMCNGGDWFYWPATGGRLRVLAPYPERVNPRLFAQAVRRGDDVALTEMFALAGIEEAGKGALCIEGRASATALPAPLWTEAGWSMIATPFVLQTAVLRAHKEIWQILEASGLSWNELTVTLPHLTNSIGPGYGFAAVVRNVNIRELAQHVWEVAARHLAQQELSLVGDAIDRVLRRGKAPAEIQLGFVQHRTDRGMAHIDAVAELIEKLRVPLNLSHRT